MYYISNLICFIFQVIMILLFYKNVLKFAFEFHKIIEGIKMWRVRAVLLLLIILLIFCKVKAHIVMPIIVDMYYFKGDIIFKNILNHCDGFNGFYEFVWICWLFEIFLIGSSLMFIYTYMAKIQANR